MDRETRDWLTSWGFASFTCFGSPIESFENKPVSIGGIRIEVCDDVCSVWKVGALCVGALATTDLKKVVEKLL